MAFAKASTSFTREPRKKNTSASFVEIKQDRFSHFARRAAIGIPTDRTRASTALLCNTIANPLSKKRVLFHNTGENP